MYKAFITKEGLFNQLFLFLYTKSIRRKNISYAKMNKLLIVAIIYLTAWYR